MATGGVPRTTVRPSSRAANVALSAGTTAITGTAHQSTVPLPGPAPTRKGGALMATGSFPRSTGPPRNDLPSNAPPSSGPPRNGAAGLAMTGPRPVARAAAGGQPPA